MQISAVYHKKKVDFHVKSTFLHFIVRFVLPSLTFSL